LQFFPRVGFVLLRKQEGGRMGRCMMFFFFGVHTPNNEQRTTYPMGPMGRSMKLEASMREGRVKLC
jgi:hypothetical protein